MTTRSGDCSNPAEGQREEGEVADLQDLCAFCLYPKRDPVGLLCRHSFCRSCLHLYFQAIDWPAKSCPLCRRSLGEPPSSLNPRCCRAKKNRQLYLKQHWRLLLLLLLALLLLSFGPFFLLLIYW